VAQALSVDAVHPLFEQAVAGDEAAFEALIGPLVEPALRLAQSMLGDRWEAEDATQEAITRAWRKLGQLRPGMPLRPWFLAIVVNQRRNVRRTRWGRRPRRDPHRGHRHRNLCLRSRGISTVARGPATPSPITDTLEQGPRRTQQHPGDSVRGSGQADQVDGMTWDGKLSGIVPVAPGTDSGNPAATLFATSSEIRDRSG
jgi:DNA-directed RNA polymerase specialized sigma24 family protein